jgi:hypothetical protein
MVLLHFLMELLAKSNALLNLVSADKTSGESQDELKILEMSLNKDDIICKLSYIVIVL